MQQSRGQRALHPRQVQRVDPDETARVVALDAEEIAEERSRHRRPTVRMSPIEIERAVAESVPPRVPARSRLARGSERLDLTPAPALVVSAPARVAFDLELDPDPDLDPALVLLPFRARRPVVATAITAALAAALLVLLHHIISAS